MTNVLCLHAVELPLETEFPVRNSQHILSCERKEKLEQRLRAQSRDIKIEFLSLMNRFFDSLEEQPVPVERLIRYLAVGKEHLFHSLENLDGARMVDVQNVIRKHSSFYDYNLVKYMINSAGSQSDKDRLDVYEEAFRKYAQRRVYECPSNYANGDIQTHNDTQFHVKLDKIYDECTLQDLEELECRLCNTLQMDIYVVRLLRVDSGCFNLTLLVPNSFERTHFPLSEDQKGVLKEIGMIHLHCGNYFVDLTVSKNRRLHVVKIYHDPLPQHCHVPMDASQPDVENPSPTDYPKIHTNTSMVSTSSSPTTYAYRGKSIPIN